MNIPSFRHLSMLKLALPLLLAMLSHSVTAASAGDIPRLADGKPDFNGIWDRPRVGNITQDVNTCGSGSVGCSSISSGPVEFTPEGLAVHTSPKIDWPARCLPWGYTRAYHTTYPVMYIQTPDNFVVLFESNNIFHIVPTDGRRHPENPEEIEETWMGKSFGWYEGDTLVIDSRGFNGMSWIDNGGEHPTSNALHIVERIRHLDADRLEYHITIEDPKYYTKPIENTRVFVRMDNDTELYEYWCMENNKVLLEGLLTETITTEE